jgi:orotate phosphoribosyltransferase
MLFATEPSPEAGLGPLSSIHLWVVYATFAIVAIYHVLHLLYDFFHYPKWLVKLFEARLRDNIVKVLHEVGFDENWRKAVQVADLNERLKKSAGYPRVHERGCNLLRSWNLGEGVAVGKTSSEHFPYYIDIMSATVNIDTADECANILTSYLRFEGVGLIPPFDFVVGIKEGSPLIASMFAHRVQKPVALFRGKNAYKYKKGGSWEPASLFDGKVERNKKALIVDDSTTGGRMVLDCIQTLRELGCEVSHCLVLFEPIGKGAKELIGQNGVQLVSVIKMDQETLKCIGAIK